MKVCGITNVDDALACAAAGVEMIGLNFSPASPRCVAASTAGEIIAATRPQFPQVKFVGVFVDQDVAFVRQLARDLALDAIQLHGNETVADVLVAASGASVVAGVADPGEGRRGQALDQPGSPPPATTRTFVIKALRVAAQLPTFADYAKECDAILLDTWNARTPGGTGETFPWSIAAELRPQVAQLILAGGLTSENVAEAIRMVRPFAVDVCSGVESAPGRKDEAKVRAFVGAVRAAVRGKMAR